jgi:protocatechuate 3,4-dioxygenase beta subunit
LLPYGAGDWFLLKLLPDVIARRCRAILARIRTGFGLAEERIVPLNIPMNRAFSIRHVSGRRRACGALVATALLPLARTRAEAAVLVPTPSQAEGPFYPKTIPAERDADLTRVAGRAAGARGTPLYFGGRALTRDGRPIAGATIELWQCDVHGRYHHAGDDGAPRDDNFQGYGVVLTDREGRYAFKTIRPVPYSGRPPHLHIRVRPENGPALTTQIYIAGDVVQGDPVLGSSPKGTLTLLSMSLAPAVGREADALAGSFDFVLR